MCEAIERLGKIEDKLLSAIECAIEDGVENVSAEEMGEVVDMLKDIAAIKGGMVASKASAEASRAFSRMEFGLRGEKPELIMENAEADVRRAWDMADDKSRVKMRTSLVELANSLE